MSGHLQGMTVDAVTFVARAADGALVTRSDLGAGLHAWTWATARGWSFVIVRDTTILRTGIADDLQLLRAEIAVAVAELVGPRGAA